jgi:hypothetical protein
MTSKRLCFEPGHKPKCLVIVDDTAEWDRAVYYASRWAIRAGGGVVMLRIIEPEQQSQEWLGVADIMRAEITPERVIREGAAMKQLLAVIDEDPDIAMLVLAANPGAEGPGPLVTLLAHELGTFPVPVTIISGALSDQSVDSLS